MGVACCCPPPPFIGLKTGSKQKLEKDEDSRTEKKTWQAGLHFVKRNVFRLQFSESREGFCQRGRGRSFHADGPKTEKAREPTVESLV